MVGWYSPPEEEPRETREVRLFIGEVRSVSAVMGAHMQNFVCERPRQRPRARLQHVRVRLPPATATILTQPDWLAQTPPSPHNVACSHHHPQTPH